MKIKFNSIQTTKNGEEQGKIKFVSSVEREVEDDFTSLTFSENRDGKKITNRIEYNQDTLRIYSGVSSLHCKLNEVIKNDYAVNGNIGSVYLYTKMTELNIENENSIIFVYKISATEDLSDSITIRIHLEIYE